MSSALNIDKMNWHHTKDEVLNSIEKSLLSDDSNNVMFSNTPQLSENFSLFVDQDLDEEDDDDNSGFCCPCCLLR